MLTRLWRAFGMAMGLYTALPGFARWDEDSRDWLAAMLPVVGLVLGCVWCGVAMIALAVLPGLLGAVAVAIAMPVMTGFLHLDGYMDVADALLSSRPQEEKLRILKDPHAGAFAVIAVVCLMLLQLGAADAILTPSVPYNALILLPVVSRGLAGIAVMRGKPLTQSAYARMNYEAESRGRVFFCGMCVVAVGVVAFVLDMRAGLACCAAALGFSLACRRAVKSLGGMNGDIAGCSICCAELCGLVALACM